MLDGYARPKEQRATFPVHIASRELSIVKKKKKRLMAVSRYTAFFIHHVYEVFQKYRENIGV